MTRTLLTLAREDATGSAPDDAYSPADIAEEAELDVVTVEAVLDALRALDHEEHPWRDPEVLQELYQDEGLTTDTIADRLGCSQFAVRRWMDRHDIEARSRDGLHGLARQLADTDPDAIGVGQ